MEMFAFVKRLNFRIKYFLFFFKFLDNFEILMNEKCGNVEHSVDIVNSVIKKRRTCKL